MKFYEILNVLYIKVGNELIETCVLQFWELVEVQRLSPSSQTPGAVAWCPRQRAPLPQPRQAWWSAPTASPRGGNSSTSLCLCYPDSVSVCSLCYQSVTSDILLRKINEYALAFLNQSFIYFVLFDLEILPAFTFSSFLIVFLD